MSWRGRRERNGYGYGYGGFAAYVPVATRRANAARHAQKLAKNEGRELAPVTISGRAMATTYWGQAWCENLEAYSDFSNRLPRGRTYARNGSIVDLQIKRGKVEAIVSGSEIYMISISIDTLTKSAWTRMKDGCSQSITSLMDLLQGRFDTGVMQRLAHPTEGMFPRPEEIKMMCSCPDLAGLCKHLAAVLYGVGNRLDKSPELLFTLRNVDHLELVNQAAAGGNLVRTLDAGDANALAGSDLGEMFGIELATSETTPKKAVRTKRASPVKVPKTAVVTLKTGRQPNMRPQSKAGKTRGSKRPKTAVSGGRRKAR